MSDLAERVQRLADASFTKQFDGAPMAWDEELTGERLIYAAYRDGVPVEERLHGNLPNDDRAMDRIRGIFLNERRTKGHDVIVWRVRPEERPEGHVYFRCVFISSRKLKAA